MAEDKKPTLKEVLAENEELKAEIAALKTVDALVVLEEQEQTVREPIPEKDRTITVSIKGKDDKSKKVTAVVADVNKLYIDGTKFTLEAFLKDKKAQATAVAAEHVLITIKK